MSPNKRIFLNIVATYGLRPMGSDPIESQIWYNMRINMSKEKPMMSAAKEPHVRYSAAYPTGRERVAKETPLPCGLSAIVLLYQ